MFLAAFLAVLFLLFLLSSSVGLLWTLSRRHLRVSDHVELMFFMLPFVVWALLIVNFPGSIRPDAASPAGPFAAPFILGAAVSVCYIVRSFVTAPLGVRRASWLCACFCVVAAIATWWWIPFGGG